jgi:hypothetical protein
MSTQPALAWAQGEASAGMAGGFHSSGVFRAGSGAPGGAEGVGRMSGGRPVAASPRGATSRVGVARSFRENDSLAPARTFRGVDRDRAAVRDQDRVARDRDDLRRDWDDRGWSGDGDWDDGGAWVTDADGDWDGDLFFLPEGVGVPTTLGIPGGMSGGR